MMKKYRLSIFLIAFFVVMIIAADRYIVINKEEPSHIPGEIDAIAETPPSRIPNFISENEATSNRTGTCVVDYVYLTDGTGKTAPTLVLVGDSFLGWHVKSIRAFLAEYDDGSLSYINVFVEFEGQAEVRVRLVYWDEYDEDTVVAITYEESAALLPSDIVTNKRGNNFMFQLLGDGVAQLISDSFGGTEGTIDDCLIIIKDYIVAFAYTDVIDGAEYVGMPQLTP